MYLPSLHAFGAILLAVVAFWYFARSKLRIEILSLVLIAAVALLLYVFPIEGEAAASGLEIAFGGFGHQALIAICCLMILGRGLVTTGALEPTARALTQLWRFSRVMGLLFTLVLAGLMSMVVNDTPVLVLVLPLLLNLGLRVGAPPSQTLMPVNCAILIGGMATTIGTSTNLLVVSIAADMGMPRLGVFAFTDIALLAALVALPYLWLIMPRLLPATVTDTAHDERLFQAAVHVSAESIVAYGPDLSAYREVLQKHHVELVAAVGPLGEARGDTRSLIAGDILRVRGAPEHLREASEALKASLANPAVVQHLRAFVWERNADLVIAELAIGAESALIDQSIRTAQIGDRYGVVVIGFYRSGHVFRDDTRLLRDEPFSVGDILLVQGPQDRLRRLQIAEGALVLEGAAEMPRTTKAPLALAIFAGVVTVAALQIVPIAIAALGGAIAMLATGCVRFDKIGRALSGEVIVLVAASIALGRALLETGAAAWLGTLLAFVLQAFPLPVMVGAMMAFAALLTNFSSNTAAAAVGTPIAVSLAQQVGAPAEPMVLAVLFGCNLCFATPIAYQTNILIMSAGGYEFRDYVRAGTPLVLLMIVTLSALLVWKYAL
ncbi:MAG: SLC13 family permease [Hyphomonadaceae bacterium]|nr:SLC13 family permease [Hyphomonadaceae bacterium]